MSDNIWSFILLVGMLGWMASTLVFVFKAFPSRGRFETRPALKWGCVVVASFIAWIVGLLNA
ncbi:MAG: hypothetical protein A2X83_07380 [Desulfuromonadales bacterium GWD2_54_10]|nr:MAG: hypothetical protein A2X83_07380 [Desulfuromonadales bacterium GWD2_54_10]